MTGARLVRGVGLVLASVVLTVSGVYVIVDLARWEWNRATLSGLVFVAALVVVVAMVVPWTAVLLWSGPAPAWIVVVMACTTATGGPAAVIAPDSEAGDEVSPLLTLPGLRP